MQLASKLYACEITHARFQPRRHSFRHGHFMALIFLDELEQLSKSLFRKSKWGYDLAADTYLPSAESASGLAERVVQFVRSQGLQDEIHRIAVLTNLKFLGYVFNPVSFFYCFDQSYRTLCCVVEVGNTFGEKKPYLVRPDSSGRLVGRQTKYFYVSPFTGLSEEFVFDLDVPDDRLRIRIDTEDGDKSVVVSTMQGKSLEFSRDNLLWLTLRYPLGAVRVIFLIHWHALLLWLKRTPYVLKEADAALQKNVLNAHRSISQRTSKL